MANTKLRFYGQIVFIIVTLSGAFLYADKLIVERHIASSQLLVRQALSQINNQLAFNLYNNFNIVKGLPALFAINPHLSQHDFSIAVKQLLDENTQFRNISAAPDLIIKYVFPLEGNEAAIGMDYRAHSDQISQVIQAKESRQISVSGPLKLVQGGEGLIFRMPVYLKALDGSDTFWGIVGAVIDTQRLYKSSGLLDDNLTIEVAIRGKDGLGEQGKVFLGLTPAFSTKKY